MRTRKDWGVVPTKHKIPHEKLKIIKKISNIMNLLKCPSVS